MEFETGITKEERATISGALAKLLADTYVLYVKTQNFHWNVHGPEFFSLHKLSQEQYEEMAEAIDEIAERIRALGFFVEGSMESFLKLTSITEDHEISPKHAYIEHLVKAHEAVIRDCRALGDLSEDHHDHATVDLMGRRLGFHEKASWMLRSQL
ncbi:MAG: DNA starvation/stationary phase protection protein [Simkaniaceae bacterium]|nr:DNA starvation/stationary phase protection protein [Candidatus Sacchlamyda saccharinae]